MLSRDFRIPLRPLQLQKAATHHVGGRLNSISTSLPIIFKNHRKGDPYPHVCGRLAGGDATSYRSQSASLKLMDRGPCQRVVKKFLHSVVTLNPKISLQLSAGRAAWARRSMVFRMQLHENNDASKPLEQRWV